MASSLLDTKRSLLDPTGIEATIYLMRHGHTVLDVDRRSDGFLDFPLSDDGRLGLIDAQQYLKTVPLDCIYAPGLKRTTETAEIIQSGTMSKPDIDKSDEGRTWNLGVLAGTPKKTGKPRVKELIANPSRAPMGGESFNDFRDRFMSWFEEMAEEVESGKPVLYVGSGSNMRLIGQELLGDADQLDLDEGGLACLHRIGDQWHVEIVLGADDNADQVS